LLEAIDVQALPVVLRNRVRMRRAALGASLAYQRARRGEDAHESAATAINELLGVDRGELTDDDSRTYADASMRVNASRWAVADGPIPAMRNDDRPRIVLTAGTDGDTCVSLVNAKRGAANPLVRRCTFGIVWERSATLNREATALALAVQHTDTWRELWIFRKAGSEWVVRSVPPAATTPGVGYAEFAGWVPGGRQILVAREASGEGKYSRSYELVRLDSLAAVAKAPDPSQLPAFARWQDPGWKQASIR
jgi:hypothetical protein